MTEIERAADNSLGDEPAFPGVLFEPSGLKLPGDMPFEVFEELGRHLLNIERSTMWWIGDWGVYGEAAYEHEFAQAVEEGPYKAETVRVAIWVAERIPPERRRYSDLTWSHHRAIAGLDAPDQDTMLALAAQDGLSVAEVRDRVRAMKGEGSSWSQSSLALAEGDVLEEAARLLRQLRYEDGRPVEWPDEDEVDALLARIDEGGSE